MATSPQSQRMAIGAVIRRRRQALGWTQATLASRAGLASPSTIVGHERGRHRDWLGHLRSLRSLAAIAEAFGTTVDVLVREAGVPDEQVSRLTLAMFLDARRTVAAMIEPRRTSGGDMTDEMDERERAAMQLACAGWVLSPEREQDAVELRIGDLRRVWEAAWLAARGYYQEGILPADDDVRVRAGARWLWDTPAQQQAPPRDAPADEALALLRELWDDAAETRTIGSYRIIVEQEQAARINRVLAAQRQEGT